jgi:hypothetical protein
MAPPFDFRERAREYLALAQNTENPQTKAWAIGFAALLQRLAKATRAKMVRDGQSEFRAGARHEDV